MVLRSAVYPVKWEGNEVDMLWTGSADEGCECVDGDSDTDWYR